MAQPDLTLLGLSEEELDQLSEITERDIVIAQQFFIRVVDPAFKNLLLAEVEIEDDEI